MFKCNISNPVSQPFADSSSPSGCSLFLTSHSQKFTHTLRAYRKFLFGQLKSLYDEGKYKEIVFLCGYKFIFDKSVLKIEKGEIIGYCLSAYYFNINNSSLFGKIRCVEDFSIGKGIKNDSNLRKKLMINIIKTVIKKEL